MNEENNLSFILENGLHKELAKAKRNDSIARKNGDEKTRNVYAFIKKYGIDLFQETNKLLNARASKLARIKSDIKPYIQGGHAIFVTLTFDDACLNRTSEKYRRELVQRYLNEQCLWYRANIDYGEKNEREHYHAIVIPVCGDHIDCKPWWKNGAIKVKKINVEKGDLARVAKYVVKLSYHAIKKSSKGTSRLLCSRSPRENMGGDELPAPNWLTLSDAELNEMFPF